MTLVRLFPRISRLGVDSMLARTGSHAWSPDRLAEANEFTRYGGSGGTRIAVSELLEMRAKVVAIAASAGFPHDQRQSARSAFDTECAKWFGTDSFIAPGEALRDDVWAYIAVCLLPDVTGWRFGNLPERYHGGVRNTFQRLWLRAQALDRGVAHADRWRLVAELSEDALVQITERPSISGDPGLARAIGEAWVETAAEIGKGRMEDVTRAAVRDIRIANEVLYIGALSGQKLREAAKRYFNDAVRRLRPVRAENA